MSTKREQIIEEFARKRINYCLLDEQTQSLTILAVNVDKNTVKESLRAAGFKKKKDKSGDVYLYGMDRYDYYECDGYQVTVCYQIACRSTLNREWVPLDRIVNLTAMQTRVLGDDNIYRLNPVDNICYRLAECVYTNKIFDDFSREDITNSLNIANRQLLRQKLALVFFGFTDIMIKKIEENAYESIIDDFWRYSDY